MSRWMKRFSRRKKLVLEVEEDATFHSEDASDIPDIVGETSMPQDMEPIVEVDLGQATGLTVELWELILRELDFQRLKACRLVCKAWNREICRIFKSQHHVTSHVDVDDDFQEWEELLERRRKNFPALPDPFGSLVLTVSRYDDSSFNYAASKLSYPVTKLKLKEYWSSNYEIGLSYCAPTLQELEVTFMDETPRWHSIPFPELETLSVGEAPESHIDIHAADWIIQIVSTSPRLTTLSIGAVCLNYLLLKWPNLECIAKLRIVIGDKYGLLIDNPSANNFKYIFNNLKLISITGNDPYREKLVPTISNILSSVSNTIENFSAKHIDLKHWVGPYPLCANLKYFEAKSVRFGSDLLEHLPSLTCLKGITFEEDYFDEHLEMSYSSMRTVGLMDDCGTLSDAKLSALVETFPNAKTWELPYKVVPNFSQFMSSISAPVQKLRIRYRFYDDGGHRSLSVCSSLQLLTGLQELEFIQSNKYGLLPLGRREFRRLAHVKTVRIIVDQIYATDLEMLGNIVKDLQNFEVIDSRNSTSKGYFSCIQNFSHNAPNALYKLQPNKLFS